MVCVSGVREDVFSSLSFKGWQLPCFISKYVCMCNVGVLCVMSFTVPTYIPYLKTTDISLTFQVWSVNFLFVQKW